GSAVTVHLSLSPPATPPPVLIRTASSTARPPVLGNMMRVGVPSKTSSIRVPFSEPLRTIRPYPSARCRPVLDAGFGHASSEQHRPASLGSSGVIACNIGYTNWSAGGESTGIHLLLAG